MSTIVYLSLYSILKWWEQYSELNIIFMMYILNLEKFQKAKKKLSKATKSDKEDGGSDFEEMEDGYEDSKELDYSETSSSGVFKDYLHSYSIINVVDYRILLYNYNNIFYATDFKIYLTYIVSSKFKA